MNELWATFAPLIIFTVFRDVCALPLQSPYSLPAVNQNVRKG